MVCNLLLPNFAVEPKGGLTLLIPTAAVPPERVQLPCGGGGRLLLPAGGSISGMFQPASHSFIGCVHRRAWIVRVELSRCVCFIFAVISNAHYFSYGLGLPAAIYFGMRGRGTVDHFKFLLGFLLLCFCAFVLFCAAFPYETITHACFAA